MAYWWQTAKKPCSHLLLLTFFLLVISATAVAQTLELRQAEFVLSDATQPPGHEVVWQPQLLPDLWIVNRPGDGGNGWYRFQFEWRGDDERIQSLYLPRLCMNGAVYLNGVLLGDGGRFDEPVARNWNRPLLFLIPPGILKQGENTLHLRLRTFSYSQGSLYPLFIGPEHELRPDYEQLYFLRITLNQTMTLIIAAIGLLMLSLWWRRRQDTMYAYFGASALLWAFNSTNLYAIDVPLSSHNWELLVHSAFPMFVALLMHSLLRFIEVRHRLLERILWLIFFLPLLSLPLARPEWLIKLATAWHTVPLLAAGVMVLLLTTVAARRRNFEISLLAAALWINVLFGIHDWLMHSQSLWSHDGAWRRNGDLHLVHYGAPLLFLVVGWIMTARFVLVLNEFEALNRELEQRVARKHAELEANFAQLESMTKERAMLEERQRIVADMHDGLGGQLVTTLRLVESNRVDGAGVAELLRECLDDMRIVMNSIMPGEHDLDAVLGTLRYRLAPRFERAGIELDWKMDGALPDYPLTAQDALHIQRILQESFTNILKHSGATRITVESGLRDEGGGRYIRIADNGHGIHGIHGEQRGRGIANMQSRAQRIGGEVRIESSQQGTVVTLLLPPAGTG